MVRLFKRLALGAGHCRVRDGPPDLMPFLPSASLPSFPIRRFWAVAARMNSSRAPFGPRKRKRSSLRMRLRCANSISIFLRSRREVRPSRDLLNHAFGGQHLRLPDCGGRLDIDDDRVLDVDQVIRRIGKEGLAAVRPCPARRWVRGRNELRRDFGRRSESGIVEDSQILVDRPAGSLRWKSLVTFDPPLSIGIGLDQARVDRKSFAPDEPQRTFLFDHAVSLCDQLCKYFEAKFLRRLE